MCKEKKRWTWLWFVLLFFPISYLFEYVCAMICNQYVCWVGVPCSMSARARRWQTFLALNLIAWNTYHMMIRACACKTLLTCGAPIWTPRKRANKQQQQLQQQQWQSVEEERCTLCEQQWKKRKRHQGNKRLFSLGDATSYMYTNICLHNTPYWHGYAQFYVHENIIQFVEFFSMQTKSGVHVNNST